MRGRARTVAAASVLVMAVMPPASAQTADIDLCHGRMNLSTGVGYPPNITSNVEFWYDLSCVLSGRSWSGFGYFHSVACGYANGELFPSTGGSATVVIVGTHMTVAGSVYMLGPVVALPDTSTVPFGNSCSNGTAVTFTLAMATAFVSI